MYGSYISGRMLNTFSYGSNFSQLPKRDNLHIKDKRPAPNFAIIRKLYCIVCIYCRARSRGVATSPPISFLFTSCHNIMQNSKCIL